MMVLMIVMVVVLMVMGEGMVHRKRPQAEEPCVCVPNTQCHSKDAGRCPNVGELCCPKEDTGKDPTVLYVRNVPGFAEPCSCHNFFDCSIGTVQLDLSSRCKGENQVCCTGDEGIFLQWLISLTDQIPGALTFLTTTTAYPGVETAEEGPCQTIGTRSGVCLPFSHCQEQLEEPVKLLTIPQFLHNYGCGTNSDGDVNVCCPT